MIHQYKLGDLCVVLDVCSGSVHAVDEGAYDMIAGFETQERDPHVDALAEMFRERMVASSRVKPGSGMAANSSSTKWTCRGRAP